MAIGIGGAIAGAIAAYGAQKVGSWLWHQMFGGGTKRRQGVTKVGNVEVAQIPKFGPKDQKYMEEILPKMINELMAKPEAFPELIEVMKQQQEAFGPPAELPGMPPEAEIPTFEFGPIAEQARKRFKEETIPTLAERFTTITGGGQRSGAFERQKAKAAEGLEKGLAALQAQLEPQYALQKAQYGLQRGALAGQLGQLGLQQRGQRLREGQFALSHMLASRQPQEERKQLLGRILGGGIASPYHQAVQPIQPSFWQGMAPGFGQAVGRFAPYALDWTLKGLGYSGLPGLYS